MPTPVQPLLRGSPAQRLRLASGLVLFVFAATHFLTPGTLLLAAALLLHAGSALVKLAGRRTLRLPAWEWLQLGLGLAIPLLLLPHIVNTRVASLALGVDTTYAYVLTRIWPGAMPAQTLLLLAVWVHGSEIAAHTLSMRGPPAKPTRWWKPWQ